MNTKQLDRLNDFESAILIQHGCKGIYQETVFVHEKTEANETVWAGNVEVFELAGHGHAKTCYIWEHYDRNGERKIFAVLGTDLINSPARAVQAAIFMDEQPPVRLGLSSLEFLKRRIEECKNFAHKIAMEGENLPATI